MTSEAIEPDIEQFEPTQAQEAAAVIMRTGRTDYIGVAIQTTHRFRLMEFFAIENMAEAAGISRAEMINLVIASGLEAIRNALPKDVLEREQDFRRITPKQMIRMDKLYPGTLQAINSLNPSPLNQQ